jgi:hypothetical protein
MRRSRAWLKRLRETAFVANDFHVEGIEEMPVYLVSKEHPWVFSMADLISGVPLGELLARATAPERLYLVDYASTPGHTRLTLLA